MAGIFRVLTRLLKFAVTCKFYDNVENSFFEAVILLVTTHVNFAISFTGTNSNQQEIRNDCSKSFLGYPQLIKRSRNIYTLSIRDES
jgi:hypothetical protein